MKVFKERIWKTLPVMVGFYLLLTVFSFASDLRVGTASVDITPEKSVPLWGQFNLRLSKGVETPITANIIAIGSYEKEKLTDAAILVSVDVVHVPTVFAKMVRDKSVAKDASINPDKIVMFAVHSHTAPTLYVGPDLPKGDNIEPYAETMKNMSDKIAAGIVDAWKKQVPADFSWGIDPVVLGESRRAVYFDGHAQMYGQTNSPEFSHFENAYDSDMGTLFFWNKEGKLLGIFVNVACTAQIVEHRTFINADYWHPTREKLKARFGKEVVIVGTNGAGGDNSPHPMHRKAALARMRDLRGQSELEEAAWKIDRAVAETYAAVVKDKKSNVSFGHRYEILDLKMRKVTKEEYLAAKEKCDSFKAELKKNPNKSPAEVAFMAIGWYGNVVERYLDQQKNGVKNYPAFVHVLRIGDVALATNQFELYTDYGMRIKVQSPAMATIIVELADGDGAYLPTDRAVKGGGYSAVVESDPVSSEGGQQLVNESLRMIKSLWK